VNLVNSNHPNKIELLFWTW